MALCGFDFGTSNSTLSVIRDDGRSVLVPLERINGHVYDTLPTAVFYHTDGEKSFGRRAVQDYIHGHDGRLMRSLKSVLGNSLIHEKTRVGKKSLAFTDIIADFVRYAKRTAEHHLGHDLTHVVVGRPVFFVDGDVGADRAAQDTLEAIMRNCGFDEVSFDYEPVAAAFDYAQQVRGEQLALIIDSGGGTTDFSVVRIGREQDCTVLANTGVHVGGTDIDKQLSMAGIMPHLGYGSRMRAPFGEKDLDIPSVYFHDLATWHKINFLYNPQTMNELGDIARRAYAPEKLERFKTVLENHLGHQLAIDVEHTKIALSSQDSVTWTGNALPDLSHHAVSVTDMNTSIEGLVMSLSHALDEVYHHASIEPHAIDVVFLTGGTTAIPYVRDSLLKSTPNATIIKGDMFGSVGMGLAHAARKRYGD